MHSSARTACALGAGLVISMLPGLAAADDGGRNNPSLTKEWVIEGGATFQNLDGSLGAWMPSGAGGEYPLSVFGLDDHDTAVRFGLRWRFSDQWQFSLNFDEIDTSGVRGNTTTIDFGRISIPAGYDVESSATLRIYSALLGYTFTKAPNYEFGVRIGANILDADASVTGTLQSGPVTVSAGAENMSVAQFAPTLGFFGTIALSDRLALEGAVDGVAFDIWGYSGHFVSASGALSYWISDNVSVGAGYRYLDAKVNYDGSSVEQALDFRSTGPFVKASVGF